MRKTEITNGQISAPTTLNLKMGHVESRSQKVVLVAPEERTADVPRPNAGTATEAPKGLDTATAATAAELAAAATKAAPEIEGNIR